MTESICAPRLPALDVRTVLPVAVGGKGEVAYRAQYLKTIGAAVAECQLDGLEFDWEPLNLCSADYPKNCTITPEHAHEFTVLLAEIKVAMGPGKLVSEDVGVWGLTQGSYPLKTTPWVNVTMLNRGDVSKHIQTLHSWCWSASHTSRLPCHARRRLISSIRCPITTRERAESCRGARMRCGLTSTDLIAAASI